MGGCSNTPVGVVQQHTSWSGAAALQLEWCSSTPVGVVQQHSSWSGAAAHQLEWCSSTPVGPSYYFPSGKTRFGSQKSARVRYKTQRLASSNPKLYFKSQGRTVELATNLQ